ncbi:MAG: carotenoid oxygenase family protein [Polyangia bacterium]
MQPQDWPITDEGVPLPEPGPEFPVSVLKGTREEWSGVLEPYAGQVPTDVSGQAFLLGASPFADGSPMFMGDGMLYRLSFSPQGKALLTRRLVRTDDLLVDEATQNRKDLAFANSGQVRVSQSFGFRNFANTAPVRLGDDRLLCCYDAGRPWEIDPYSMDTLTPVGALDAWRSGIPALNPALGFFPLQTTTAHPAYDPDERLLYLVNYAPLFGDLNLGAFTRIVRWDGTGALRSTEVVDERGQPVAVRQCLHQIQVTRNFVILQDGAFRIELAQLFGQEKTEAQMPVSVFYIVPKAGLVDGGKVRAVRVEIPIESIHFMAERDDAGDRVTLLVNHQGSMDVSEWLRKDDVEKYSGRPVSASLLGAICSPADRCVLGKYAIDARTGQVLADQSRRLDEERLWGLALWTQDERPGRPALGTKFWMAQGFVPSLFLQRIYELYKNHPHRTVGLAELPRQTLPPRLLRIDHQSMRITDEFLVPQGHVLMAPVFMPRKGGGPDEGYVVTLVARPEPHEVWIFAASDLRRGPICRLRHPKLQAGFLIHSCHMPDVAPQPPRYRIDRADDYRDRLKLLGPEAQKVARAALKL